MIASALRGTRRRPEQAAPQRSRRKPAFSCPEFLEVVDRLRPVVLQQPGERSVREELSARLAPRAVVGLVLGVDDALDRRLADRAGLPVLAMHREVLPERRDL